MTEGSYQRLLGNAGWLSAGELLSRLAGLFVAFYLARVFGPTGYGMIGTAFAVFSYFSIFVQVGLEPRGIREISRNSELARAVFARTSALRLILALCMLGTLLSVSPFLARVLSIPWWLFALYGLGFFPIALSAAWVLRGLEQMPLVAIAIAGQRILIVAGVLLFVSDPATDLRLVPIIELSAMVLVASWSIHRLRRLCGHLSYNPGVEQWRPMMHEAVPVAGSRILMMVYVHADILMLGWLAGPTAAGEFLASHKLILTLWQVSIVFQLASYSETARRVQGDRMSALTLQADVLRYLLVLAVPCVIVALFFSESIVRNIYGHQFMEAAPVLAIMALSIPISFAAGCLVQLLLADAVPGYNVAAYAMGTIVHLAAALFWIPADGPTGAAWACLAGEAVAFAVLTFFVGRRFGGLPWDRSVAAPLIAGATTSIGIIPLSSSGFGVQLVIGGMLYVSTVLLTGGIRQHEVSLAVAALSRRNRHTS